MPEDVRVRAIAASRADEDAVSLVPVSFEVGYVAEDGSAFLRSMLRLSS
jgi:hypothetical protein